MLSLGVVGMCRLDVQAFLVVITETPFSLPGCDLYPYSACAIIAAIKWQVGDLLYNKVTAGVVGHPVSELGE